MESNYKPIVCEECKKNTGGYCWKHVELPPVSVESPTNKSNRGMNEEKMNQMYKENDKKLFELKNRKMNEKELAGLLEEYGFPTITKWEQRNNAQRRLSANGKPTLPFLEAILSELPKEIAIFSSGYEYDNPYYGVLNDLNGEVYIPHYTDEDGNDEDECTKGDSFIEVAVKLYVMHRLEIEVKELRKALPTNNQ